MNIIDDIFDLLVTISHIFLLIVVIIFPEPISFFVFFISLSSKLFMLRDSI